MNPITKALPFIDASKCLNTLSSPEQTWHCQICADMCPAEAITFTGLHLPNINSESCTGCLGCLSPCPNDALGNDEVHLIHLVQQASDLVKQTRTDIDAACSAHPNDNADINVTCHAIWSPLLLASFAAEGIQTLNLHGIQSCKQCPKQFGEQLINQVKHDYDTLNQALGIRLHISTQAIQEEPKPKLESMKEPERRTFFRTLLPTLAKNSISALSQLTHEEQAQGDVFTTLEKDNSKRPTILKLFSNALPKLQCDFTPIPWLSDIALGSIQVDDTCTACGDCTHACPTQALSLRAFGRQHILELNASACTGCELCTHLCLENSITMLPSISLPSLLSDKARPLVMIANHTK